MRTRTLSILSLGLAVLALPASILAAGADEELVPITDPALLASLGFPPDTTNLSATPRALRHMAMTPAERAAAQEALRRELEAETKEGIFGTASDGATLLSYQSFRPTFSVAGLAPEYNSAPETGLACQGGTHTFEAQLAALPQGVALSSVRVFVRDDSDEDITAWLYRICQVSPFSDPVTALVDTATTAGTPGTVALDLAATSTTSQHCLYTVRARLDDSGHLIFECSEGNDLRLFKARALWRRQISPPPPVATFDDVPTDHLFFQHIEALAASSITGGCGGDSFCPNAPLTRAQMAAFLATALGLHWGNF